MQTFARPVCRRCKGYFGYKKGRECCMDCGTPREADNPDAVPVAVSPGTPALVANESTYGQDAGGVNHAPRPLKKKR